MEKLQKMFFLTHCQLTDNFGELIKISDQLSYLVYRHSIHYSYTRLIPAGSIFFIPSFYQGSIISVVNKNRLVVTVLRVNLMTL
jgi:hypothetical protein